MKKVRDQSGEGASAVNEAVVHAPKRQTLLCLGLDLACFWVRSCVEEETASCEATVLGSMMGSS